MLMVVFWNSAGGNVLFNPHVGQGNVIKVSAGGNCAIILRLQDSIVTVSDPS